MKKNERLYVDIHVLQTVPPSCVNRDDTGSPKIAVYGGATRARVSSQCWKRAIRLMFRDLTEQEDIGLRTKALKDLLVAEIAKTVPCKAEEYAETVMKEAGLNMDKEGKTEALFFVSQAQIKALAELAGQLNEGKKADKDFEAECKQALLQMPGIDMALFGRMVAKDSSLNYDAAAQVAHAISTHAVHNEYDYFTAVDDCAPEDKASAAHLGTVEYNSSTLYRYATVNVMELKKNLGMRAVEVSRLFAEAFICSMPTGKQNTFANRTLPDTVYLTIRKDQPVNLVGAFEKPVSGKQGYVQSSVQALSEHAANVYSDYACPPASAWCTGKVTPMLGQKVSLTQMLEALQEELTTVMEEEA